MLSAHSMHMGTTPAQLHTAYSNCSSEELPPALAQHPCTWYHPATATCGTPGSSGASTAFVGRAFGASAAGRSHTHPHYQPHRQSARQPYGTASAGASTAPPRHPRPLDRRQSGPRQPASGHPQVAPGHQPPETTAIPATPGLAGQQGRSCMHLSIYSSNPAPAHCGPPQSAAEQHTTTRSSCVSGWRLQTTSAGQQSHATQPNTHTACEPSCIAGISIQVPASTTTGQEIVRWHQAARVDMCPCDSNTHQPCKQSLAKLA